MTNNTVLHVMC